MPGEIADKTVCFRTEVNYRTTFTPVQAFTKRIASYIVLLLHNIENELTVSMNIFEFSRIDPHLPRAGNTY